MLSVESSVGPYSRTARRACTRGDAVRDVRARVGEVVLRSVFDFAQQERDALKVGHGDLAVGERHRHVLEEWQVVALALAEQAEFLQRAVDVSRVVDELDRVVVGVDGYDDAVVVGSGLVVVVRHRA